MDPQDTQSSGILQKAVKQQTGNIERNGQNPGQIESSTTESQRHKSLNDPGINMKDETLDVHPHKKQKPRTEKIQQRKSIMGKYPC